MLPSSFSEKNKWVTVLQSIVAAHAKQNQTNDAKLLGNSVVYLTGNSKLDVNCTLLLGDEVTEAGVWSCFDKMIENYFLFNQLL